MRGSYCDAIWTAQEAASGERVIRGGHLVSERRLGEWRWVSLRGDRRAVFSRLGEAFAGEIDHILRMSTDLKRLSRFRKSSRLGTLEAATSASYTDEMEELEALADGAGVSFEDLLILNLRGDLIDLGEGCSDVAVAGPQGSLLIHNEDGAPLFDGRCAIVTLHIEGEISVTSVWYPGFLPGMTAWLNGRGVGCGVDHIPLAAPGDGAGRHFQARALQKAESVADAITIAAAVPIAGGYSYTFGSADRLVNLESSPAGVHQREIPEFHAHTNHFIYSNESQTPDQRSFIRLSALRQLEGVSRLDDLVEAMTSQGSIHRHAADGDPLLTLCTIGFDFTREEIAVVLRHDRAIHRLSFDEFVS